MPRACVVRPRIAPVRRRFGAAVIDAFVPGPSLMAFWIGVIRVYRWYGEPAMRNMRPAGDMQNLTLGHANADPVSFCMAHMPRMTRSTRTVASVRFCMNASASAAPARRTSHDSESYGRAEPAALTN
jgi:hypothetical protein